MIEIVTLISVILFLVVLLFTPILPPTENYKNIPFTNNMRSSRDILNVLGRDNNHTGLKTPNKAKIISFEWDCAGFNNVRMAFEVACAISVIFDRTIVMPPKAYWDHMPKGYIMDLSDFYDLDSIRKHVPLISSSEYLGKTVTYDEFKQIMSSKNGLSKELLTKLPQEYQKLSDKQQEPVWFFLSCKKENGKDKRIFGNFNSIFRDSPKLTKIRYTIKNGMKFKSELLDLVPNIPPGSYDAVHARLGDFQHTYEKGEKNPMETLQRNLTRLLKPKDNSHKLLIITPEKDKSKFDSLKKDFDIQFLQYHQRTPSIWLPLIDTLACVSARRFLGNKLSTFTYYIQILRGYCATNRQKDLSQIIDATPEYHNKSNESIIAKIGKAWNCFGNCWNILDTEQWLDPKLKELEEISTHFPLTKTAFYINLDKDTRRNRHIQTLLNSIGFENINRITPIKDPIGWKSLTKSHKYILEQISKFEKEEYYFVFEDDIALAREENPKNVFKLIKSEMDELISAKMRIPFIYLGACLDNNQWGKCTNNVCNAWCTHAYMLTPKAAKWVLENVPDWEKNTVDNNYLQILHQPLVGHKFTHDHTSPQWRGLFYQGRKESWYTDGLTENNPPSAN